MKPILSELDIAALCGGRKARRTIAASDNAALLGGIKAKNNGRYNGNGLLDFSPASLPFGGQND